MFLMGGHVAYNFSQWQEMVTVILADFTSWVSQVWLVGLGTWKVALRRTDHKDPKSHTQPEQITQRLISMLT
jgi:hypothetical protein